jgi:hypothetical protein
MEESQKKQGSNRISSFYSNKKTIPYVTSLPAHCNNVRLSSNGSGGYVRFGQTLSLGS